jgi:D-glycero-alpha-D-manno-heptose 1-phosphate guanylyltransferase
MKTKEAIILAGGLGTRLRTAVPDLPKCMAPVAGKPFIYYVIDYFHKQGIENFILSLGYKHEVIQEYVQTRMTNINFTFSIEEEPLGTGGAFRLACKKAKEKTVLALNGDTLFKVDLNKLIPFHHMCGADCTLSLKPMRNFERYGVVGLNNDYSIRAFHEKKYYEAGLINGGVYALNVQKFQQEELPEKFSFEKDYLELLYSTRRMYGVVQDEYFIDIGIPEDYKRAQIDFEKFNLQENSEF